MSGERVTKSRRQAIAQGRKRLSAILSAEGSERYARLKDAHGSEAALIEAALKALEGSNELTNADLLATLAARLKTDAEQNPKTERDIARDMPKTEIAPKSVKPNLLVTPPPRKIKDIDKA